MDENIDSSSSQRFQTAKGRTTSAIILTALLIELHVI